MSNDNLSSTADTPSCGPTCDCAPPPVLARRDFLALSTVGLAAATLAPRRAVAGPFETADFARLIPPDKKLKPDWVRGLTARGEPTVYTKARNELRYIGMPVGGICCGTLYLGGDGKLWVWDIFNQNQNGILPRSVPWEGFGQPRTIGAQDGAAYVQPHLENSPLDQGFAVRVDGKTRRLDAGGWESISFAGTYPIGTIHYADPDSPVAAQMVAYSPFIPLNADDSGLPATICEITVHNVSGKVVTTEVGGWLENACSLYSAQPGSGLRENAVRTVPGATMLACRFADKPVGAEEPSSVPDIVIGDWSSGTYGAWKVAGTAFGGAPIARKNVPGYQGDLGGAGDYLVNTHSTGPGTTVEQKDSATGTLTSPAFAIERPYLAFPIGGGKNAAEVGIRLIVDGATARQASGRDDNHMRDVAWNVAEFVGKTATIEVYDKATGPWGNVGVGTIVQTSKPVTEAPKATDADYGTLALAVLDTGIVVKPIVKPSVTPETLFDAPSALSGDAAAIHPVGTPAIGGVTHAVKLAAGEAKTVTFVVVWHFPNSSLNNVADSHTGNYYAKRFADAPAVAAYVAANYARLSRDTKLWRDTWYDATLPHWFLDRTFANTSTLATTTAHRFQSGRFWAWEGVGCCEGTCTHVWHYAQAVGRIFPELERQTREFVDFGIAFNPSSGMIGYRGEHTGPAVDGQCGRILGAYREHTMSADGAFLARVYPRVRAALEFLMRHDSDGDGLLDGAQENTLDAAWYGKIAWISGLYAAALAAGVALATDSGDADFARQCAARLARTRAALEDQLFNGEYFIQKPEPGREGALGTYQTCHIDQVHGQSWAWQVGLPRVLDRDKTVSALRALYRYNFAPDVGPFRRRNIPGRAYALEGDGGLIMATNPQEIPHAFGNSADWQYGYFNECMSGFEHQAASHMIAEGLVEEGLAVTRAVHDRYHAARRNPYNEIECSDHYARAMASYGSFITLCGFTYDGPRGQIGWSPRLTPDHFRAAFTAAEGWGTFEQKRTAKGVTATIALKHGRLSMQTIALDGSVTGKTATVTCEGQTLPATLTTSEGRHFVTLTQRRLLQAGQTLTITLSG